MEPVKKYLPEKTIALLQKQHYALFGHSAIKICHYTKAAIIENKTCYKQKFYGIQSHQCIQLSPASAFCDQKCIYCWRPIHTFKARFPKKKDAPEEIVSESKKAQKRQLSGIGGRETFNATKFAESKQPQHVAISLTGEPCLYPDLPKLIAEYHKQKISTFLVTNALHPEMLEKLIVQPPTQLYLSVDTATEKEHKQLNNPQKPHSWKHIQQSIQLLPKIPTRTVIRITCIKGKNMKNAEKYAALISKGKPDFVEVKAYMHVGFSQFRLKATDMPNMPEIQQFAQKIAKYLGYEVRDEEEDSLVVLLTSPRWKGKSTIIDFKKLFSHT